MLFFKRADNNSCLWSDEIISSVAALQLPLGKTTVMHLVARENLPEPNNQGGYCRWFCFTQ